MRIPVLIFVCALLPRWPFFRVDSRVNALYTKFVGVQITFASCQDSRTRSRIFNSPPYGDLGAICLSALVAAWRTRYAFE